MKLYPRYALSIDEFLKRRRIAQGGFSEHTNCVGTALFLAGVISKDVYVEPGLKKVQEFFVDIESGQATFMVAEYKKGEKTKIQHVLIFHPFDHSLVYHRIGEDGPFMDASARYAHQALLHYNKNKNLYVRYCGLNHSAIDKFRS